MSSAAIGQPRARLRLVADDLTGALDSAAQFCGVFGPVAVRSRPGAGSPLGMDGGAVAVNMASRDRQRDEAVRVAEVWTPFLLAGERPFKKIDSLLRGHWAAELAATLRHGFASCVLAPAFPAQGRVTRRGRQFLRSAAGAFAQVGRPLASELAAEGLDIALPGTGAGRVGRPLVHVFDASTQQDLARAVAVGCALPGPVLWCGSAGLAAALAGVPAPRAGRAALSAPLLVLIGTDHPVSRRQVEEALRFAPDSGVRLGSDFPGNLAASERALVSGRGVLTVELPDDCDSSAAARVISARLTELLPALRPPGTFIVAGGETLLSACDGLGVETLTVFGEYGPGIPISRLSGGHWDGTLVVSKSGAFGEDNLLASLLSGQEA